jgi:hypothetical protein
MLTQANFRARMQDSAGRMISFAIGHRDVEFSWKYVRLPEEVKYLVMKGNRHERVIFKDYVILKLKTHEVLGPYSTPEEIMEAARVHGFRTGMDLETLASYLQSTPHHEVYVYQLCDPMQTDAILWSEDSAVNQPGFLPAIRSDGRGVRFWVSDAVLRRLEAREVSAYFCGVGCSANDDGMGYGRRWWLPPSGPVSWHRVSSPRREVRREIDR